MRRKFFKTAEDRRREAREEQEKARKDGIREALQNVFERMMTPSSQNPWCDEMTSHRVLFNDTERKVTAHFGWMKEFTEIQYFNTQVVCSYEFFASHGHQGVEETIMGEILSDQRSTIQRFQRAREDETTTAPDRSERIEKVVAVLEATEVPKKKRRRIQF